MKRLGETWTAIWKAFANYAPPIVVCWPFACDFYLPVFKSVGVKSQYEDWVMVGFSNTMGHLIEPHHFATDEPSKMVLWLFLGALIALLIQRRFCWLQGVLVLLIVSALGLLTTPMY